MSKFAYQWFRIAIDNDADEAIKPWHVLQGLREPDGLWEYIDSGREAKLRPIFERLIRGGERYTVVDEGKVQTQDEPVPVSTGTTVTFCPSIPPLAVLFSDAAQTV